MRTNHEKLRPLQGNKTNNRVLQTFVEQGWVGARMQAMLQKKRKDQQG
jgi:hypothetical protein